MVQTTATLSTEEVRSRSSITDATDQQRRDRKISDFGSRANFPLLDGAAWSLATLTKSKGCALSREALLTSWGAELPVCRGRRPLLQTGLVSDWSPREPNREWRVSFFSRKSRRARNPSALCVCCSADRRPPQNGTKVNSVDLSSIKAAS